MQAYWEENEIRISGSGSEDFQPALDFSQTSFPADLLRCTTGFTKPTPIQSQVTAASAGFLRDTGYHTMDGGAGSQAVASRQCRLVACLMMGMLRRTPPLCSAGRC